MHLITRVYYANLNSCDQLLGGLSLRHQPPTLVSVFRAVLQAAEVWAQFRSNPSILRKSSYVSGDIRAVLRGRSLPRSPSVGFPCFVGN